jgi:hypothetical protein
MEFTSIQGTPALASSAVGQATGVPCSVRQDHFRLSEHEGGASMNVKFDASMQ